MATYAEYLRTLGAADADIVILDTPVARRAFDKQQADLTTAETARVAAEKVATDTKDWFDNVQTPEWNGLQSELIVARAEAAKFKTALRTAADRGLLNITKDLGIEVEGTPTTPTTPATPAGFDPTKYVTREQLVETARLEGNAIAVAQDIAAEHAVLFPGQRLNFTALRDEALQARKPVLQHWMDKFKVADARTAQAKAISDAHDVKMREEGRKEERERFSKEYGANPDLRTPMPSTSPFTVRKDASDMRGAQPWARNEGTLSDDRVRRATERQASREAGRPVN